MDFFTKLRKSAAEKNQSQRARSVGLKANTISSYLAKRSMPRADIAFKIACALEVPLDWLLDDKQDWPPPTPEKQPLSRMSDDDLMREVATRFRRDALRLIEAVESIERTDWQKLANDIARLPHVSKLPDELRPSLRASHANPVYAFLRFTYDIRRYAREHHKELPGAERAPDELEPENFVPRGREFVKNNAYYGIVERFAAVQLEVEAGAKSMADLESARQSLVAAVRELQRGTLPSRYGRE